MPIFLTAFVVAILDGAFAIATVWARLGTGAPARVFQSVAAGALGKASFTGGTTTAMIGIVCHFIVALGWTLGWFFVARRLDVVRRLVATPRGQWIAAGCYGALIWLGMCYVVIPLSRATAASPSNWRFWANFAWHIVGIGPIIVFSAERGYSRTRRPMPDALPAV